MSLQFDQSTSTTPRLEGPRPAPEAGVLETTLVVDGHAVSVEEHLVRLEASLRELYRRPAPADARELVVEAGRGTALGRLRLTVAPDAQGRLAAAVRVAPFDERLVFPAWDGAAELAPVVVPGGIGAHKWADRRLLERAEADVAPALPLLVDDDGSLLEAARANLFLVSGETLLTPPADGRLLPGITRGQAIEAARSLGLAVREQLVGPEALSAADEAFLTGAVRGIEPVRRCAGVADWSEGPVTVRLAAALRRLWMV
jgi:para-aminobenzoate synthetase / 4-amino-4-deoxychorismate lyase